MEINNINSGEKWLLGIQKSKSPIEIGYFEKTSDLQHSHHGINEYYLVFSGQMKMDINGKQYTLKSGDVLFIEPGEKHRVVSTSPALKCFLVKWPHLPKDKAID
jgi:mannose-6-phosphate isomerase-like protein (cupin superfamily)